MAKSSITNISTTNTFQNWFDKTNELVNLVKSDVLTASSGGDVTIGNATLQGNFTANNIIASTLLRVDDISPKVGSTEVEFSAPVFITTNQTVLSRLSSTSGPRVSLFNSGDTDWTLGFENNTNKNFTISNGAATLRLTSTGNIEITGILSGTASIASTVALVATNTTNATHYPVFVDAATGNENVRTDTGFTYNPSTGTLTSTTFVGNLTGNVTGTVTGSVTADVTGNVSGNAGTVTNGVYTVGDQTIGGIKTFTSTIVGNISGNAGSATNASAVTNGVYTIGNQTIGGIKTFNNGTASTNTTTGSIVITGGLGVSGAINTGGAINAGGDVTAFSDERLKTNIKTITSPLDKVLALRGVSFEKDGKSSIGVIAQEIEKVIPEVVHDGEFKSVAYGNLVGLLIEAIKELKAELDELKGS